MTKAVVVVDAHVDVHDYEEVLFRVGANVDPQRDVLITEGPLDHLDHVMDLVDLVLVMSVNPGFGGQSYLPAASDKIRRARALRVQERARSSVRVTRGA